MSIFVLPNEEHLLVSLTSMKLEKALKLHKEWEKAHRKWGEAEENFKTKDDELFKHIKTLNQKEFEQYIEVIDKP